MHIIHNSNKTDIPVYVQYSTANQPLTDDGVYSSQGRSQDFSKGGSQRLLTRLYMVYTAALPRVSAGSVILLRHEGPY